MSNSLTSPVTPAKTSTAAIWSLVLGILSIGCLWLLGSIPAIVLGIRAVKRIDQSGGALKGRGLGIAGIVTGSVGIFTGISTVAILAATALPAYNGVRIKAQQTMEISQIQQISVACMNFSNENNGAFPASLPQLLEGGFVDQGTLEPKQAIGVGFLYRPGLNMTTSIPEPYLASPVPIGGKRVIGRTDGTVELIGEEVFRADYAHLFPRN